MNYFLYLLKKSFRSMLISAVLIFSLWGVLYHLTDFKTVIGYILAGLLVCAINTIILNLKRSDAKSLIIVKSTWIIAAGAVLVLFHAGFDVAAVFAAAAIFASPFFGATIAESIVGLTLLIILVWIRS